MNAQKTGFEFLLPALMNPATATVLAIGVVGFGLMKLLAEDESDEDKPPVNRSAENLQPSKPSIQPSVDHHIKSVEIEHAPQETKEELLHSTLVVPESDIIDPAEIIAPDLESDRAELIRQYMSELGKRSAAARARKREAARNLLI